jgi:dTDP-4-dehydrorhamnose reductase
MRVLITGSNGQLGSEINDLAVNYKNVECIFKDLPELDICNINALETFITDHQITAVINCAAYTSVDKAEEDANTAELVNSIGVSNIINAMLKVNGKLIHISTDYVFDGKSYIPYTELDSVNPNGVYGLTKRSGELAVIRSSIDAIIIRTSWLYSAYGNNFVKTMLRLGNEKDEIGVILDQIGTPTYARDLAKVCLEIISKPASEQISKNGSVYHYSNYGVASWYDFAIAIMELGNINCKVNPIQTKDYFTLAKRPQYSVLNKSKIKKDFNINIHYWRDSLKDCIEKLTNFKL